MWKADIINSGKHIEFVLHTVRDTLTFLVVEANEKDISTYTPKSSFQTILPEAIRRTLDLGNLADYPTHIAETISSLLIGGHEAFGPPSVLYCGIALGNSDLSVCTAGDCRVHVVRDGRVVFVTRDHNVLSDPIDGFVVPQGSDEILLGSVTRVLGVNFSGRGPESFSFPLETSDEIYVISSNLHKYRDPTEYSYLFRDPPTFQSQLSAIWARLASC